METAKESVVEKYQEDAGKRQLTGAWFMVARTAAVAMAIFHLYTAVTGPVNTQNAVHLLFALPLIFLAYHCRVRDTQRIPWFDVIPILLSVVISAYYVYHFDRIIYQLGYLMPTTLDLVFGVSAILLLLEACRRAIGLAFPILVLIALAYAAFGQHLPGVWGHGGFRWDDLVATFYLGPTGIFGSLMRTSSTVIVVFIMFGALLVTTGGGDTFMRLSNAATGGMAGGPAKAATLCSAMFGSISGSTAANVATTGVFTIPLMKKNGYSARFAAATEASASTGGQILPPIMGAAAFVMADVISTSYLDIISAALIPALLFYLAIWMSVHFEAKRLGLNPIPKDQRPTLREGLFNVETLLLPLVVLITMLVLRYTPTTAAVAAYFTAMGLYLVSPRSQGTLWERVKSLPAALEAGAMTAAMIAVIIGSVAIIAAVISITGLGLKVSSLILMVSGGDVLVTLLLAMVVAIILGMGLPTVAAYMLAASVVAAAFVEAGLPSLSAHLFILYFAILSGVTPPVALAAYIGGAIAGSHWFRTALTATKISLGGFLIPFMFIYHPPLLGQGSKLDIAMAVASGVLGIIALAASTIGYFARPCSWIERGLLLFAALMLINGQVMTDVVGIAVIVGIFAWQRFFSHAAKGDRSLARSPSKEPL
ncbi:MULTISPECIES: TRAP transporter fused permease subunit [Halomonadaceae]|uniref:TRAP transporter permease n=1 Tax=Halomonadaceae TaxID=28256 RepID=UPI001C62CCF1|nr:MULTISPECIES: TRAP transporter fused permease subunit [Halomonas]MCG7576437.1 TRAP transporter fused permease subunit [Halomonas sp. MMH1-48]MCG7590691.1 TRAP transporter fused permease subunit [Halomonas sp. McD50-5]MCG7603500.1 TRAP transporter fused permease subunit [Halomonas sp. MM17-34]MCG7612750.1 TRAP transporter fused permease subunit [Halomonas sp. MM17-29]MCG7616803.1 TRAP transporter fused permease subunit [Halomonas sp. McD50-4]